MATSSSRAETAGTWPGPPPAAEDGALPVAAFNEHVERAGGGWTRSPLLVAINFLAIDGQGAGKTTIEVEATPEGGDEAAVTVTLDGLLDDSVRAHRTAVALERQADGSWRLRSARREQRCWPERGHEDFSTEPCL